MNWWRAIASSGDNNRWSIIASLEHTMLLELASVIVCDQSASSQSQAGLFLMNELLRQTQDHLSVKILMLIFTIWVTLPLLCVIKWKSM